MLEKLTREQTDEWCEKLVKKYKSIRDEFVSAGLPVPEHVRERLNVLGEKWDADGNAETDEAFRAIETGLDEILSGLDNQ